jgi:hypothetical protein
MADFAGLWLNEYASSILTHLAHLWRISAIEMKHSYTL